MSKSIAKLLNESTGFEWNKGNRDKNWQKHRVDTKEAEEVFFNQPQMLFYDTAHSQQEDRYGILGVTDQGRRLTVYFTIRSKKIRVISARDQNRGKEWQKFEAKKEAA